MSNLDFALARRVTERYLEESSERTDAADRAARARRLIDKPGVTMETLELYYNDSNMELVAEFLLESSDHTFGALFEFMEARARRLIGEINEKE
jgi:hypothetical protein